MRKPILLVPTFVSFLFVLGFAVHLCNLGQYVAHGHTQIANFLSRTFDAGLAAWMTFCAVLLLGGRRRMFAAFEVGGWRRAIYWLITFYVTASLPGHYRYIVTGDTGYFDLFPWGFSVAIMVVYVLFIWFLLSLQPREGASAPDPAVHA